VRISCPFCGPRGNEEFSYLGDARLTQRPDPAATDAVAAFHDYVYQRENPSGAHRELWYHGGGCRKWLVVTRNARTHEVSEVKFAGGGATP
jgi:sarcosine oxidase subunit delta